MERIVHKARSFKEADEWDKRQHQQMTPDERFAIARELQRRVFGPNPPDVREWQRANPSAPVRRALKP
jgi:hypothetical protein